MVQRFLQNLYIQDFHNNMANTCGTFMLHQQISLECSSDIVKLEKVISELFEHIIAQLILFASCCIALAIICAVGF